MRNRQMRADSMMWARVIGKRLRQLAAEIESAPLPARILELLKQLEGATAPQSERAVGVPDRDARETETEWRSTNA